MRRIVLVLGPAALLVAVLLPPPGNLQESAWHVAGVAAWMALWWLSAVVPLEATALIPIVLLPILGVRTLREVTASYADPIIFLFLGGFLIAATLERWDLHRRFAIGVVHRVGTDAPRVVLAFMITSAVASMWISNTATAVMMLPIALALTAGRASEKTLAGPSDGFPIALLLGIAYGCSIGGVATLIGTPPNAIFAASARELLGEEVSFARWMVVGIPVSVPMLVLSWVALVKMFRVRGEVEGLAGKLESEGSRFGRLSGGERFVAWVFVLTAVSWILRAPKTVGSVTIPGLSDLVPGISDAAIAIAAALIFFVVPLGRQRFSTALDWETARQVPWGILLLFGGGLALAGAFEASGLAEWIGARLGGLRGAGVPLVVFTTAAVFVLLTELTSNTATAALGMPLMAGVAQGIGIAALPLMAATALAASMAFMLPVATPPNAIVFGSGAIAPKDMARAGLGLNLLAVAIITVVVTIWTT